MNARSVVNIAAVTAILLLAGCNQSPSNEGVTAAVAPEHMATGTLNAVDAAAGTVNITHGPVPSAGWPEMTMSFKLADSQAATELEPGERVDFHFRIDDGMNATVTFIAPLD